MDLLLRAQAVHRVHHVAEHGADEHAAVDQDRRLPRGLRVLSAERALRRPGSEAQPLMQLAEVRDARAPRPRRRRHALLHGRRLPCAQGARPASDRRHDPRSARARAGDLRHARHARAPAQAQTLKEAGPRLLQPQSRHLERVLRRRSSRTRSYQDRLDTLSAVRDGGPEGVLRRHRRHGRVARAIARSCCARSRTCPSIPRACRSISSCGCRARRWRAARDGRPVRLRAHHRRRAPAHAARAGAPVRRSRAR